MLYKKSGRGCVWGVGGCTEALSGSLPCGHTAGQSERGEWGHSSPTGRHPLRREAGKPQLPPVSAPSPRPSDPGVWCGFLLRPAGGGGVGVEARGPQGGRGGEENLIFHAIPSKVVSETEETENTTTQPRVLLHTCRARWSRLPTPLGAHACPGALWGAHSSQPLQGGSSARCALDVSSTAKGTGVHVPAPSTATRDEAAKGLFCCCCLLCSGPHPAGFRAHCQL